MKNQNGNLENIKARKGAPLKKFIVGVDSGFGRVKVAYTDTVNGNPETFEFSSRTEINEYDVMIENTMYINGVPHNLNSNKKAVQRDYLTKDNPYTISNMHRALFEIARRTGFRTKKFIVGLGCSLDTYRDPVARENFRQLALKDRKLKFEYKGTKVTLEIEDVIVQPETICSVYNIAGFNKSEINWLVDLGTQNSQIVKYFKSPDLDNARPRDFGYQSIVRALQDEYRAIGRALDEDRIETIIENGRDKEFIDNYIINKFLEGTIKRELKAVKADLDLDTFIFVGGTSLRFKRQIKQVFKKALFASNPLFSNVLGMFARTRALVKKQEETQKVGA